MNPLSPAHNPHEDDSNAWDTELARRVAERVEEALADPVVLADMTETDAGVRRHLACFVHAIHYVLGVEYTKGLRRDLARAVTDRVAEEMMEEGKNRG